MKLFSFVTILALALVTTPLVADDSPDQKSENLVQRNRISLTLAGAEVARSHNIVPQEAIACGRLFELESGTDIPVCADFTAQTGMSVPPFVKRSKPERRNP